MLNISETTYHQLFRQWPEVAKLEIAFIKDWSEVMPGIKYYVISNEKNGSIIGAFALFFSKRKGLEHVSNPPFFQTCGFVLKNAKSNKYDKQSLTKRMFKQFSNFLGSFSWVNISVPHVFLDMQPFIWDGYNVSPRYTYILDISSPVDALTKNFSKGLKNDISKLSRSEVEYKEGISQETIDFLFQTSAKNRVETEQVVWKRMMTEATKDQDVTTVTAQFEEYQGVASVFKVGKTGIYMFGNSDKDSPVALNTAALLKIINGLKESGVTHLDFEGSMIPGIERYFRSFGGELTPYFNLLKEPKLIRTARLLKS